MAYLSDTAKQHIKAIIKRWEELGHAPSHKEFNSDPKVTNAMASCFGSYNQGVKEATYYYNHPEQRYKLDPPPPPPPKTEETKGKKRKKSRVVQSIQEPSKPPEQATPLKVGETRIIPKIALKTPLTASEEPKPEPEETIITPIEERIAGEPANETLKCESAPPQEPEITPIPKPEPTLDESDKEPEIEAQTEPEPEVRAETESEEESIPVPEPTKEVVFMSQNNQTVLNLIGKPVRLVNAEQFNKALTGVRPDISLLQDGGTAIVMKAEISVDSHLFEASDELIEIPIVSVYGQPAILRDKLVHNFPEPKDGVLLLVSREVAEAARDIGRDTDDLVYPLEFAVYDKCMYCKKFGRI